MQNADRQKSAAKETIDLTKVCGYELISRYHRRDVDYDYSIFQTIWAYYLKVVWTVLALWTKIWIIPLSILTYICSRIYQVPE